jgi:hypothetical protein
MNAVHPLRSPPLDRRRRVLVLLVQRMLEGVPMITRSWEMSNPAGKGGIDIRDYVGVTIRGRMGRC